MVEKLHTVAEAAAILRIGRTKAYRLISVGRLYAFQVDGPRSTVVPESAIEAFLAAQQQPTGQPNLRLVHDVTAVA